MGGYIRPTGQGKLVTAQYAYAYAFIVHLQSPFFCRRAGPAYLLTVLHTFCTSRPFQPMHIQLIPNTSSAHLSLNGYTARKKKAPCP